MKQLRNVLSVLAVIVVAVLGYYQNQTTGGSSGVGGPSCQDELRAGQPTSSVQGSTVLCRNEYISLYDPGRKVPLMVAEHLTRAELVGDVPRSNEFQPDPDLLPGQRAELSDYRGSGYDRGHMAPAADFEAGQTQMVQSFFLSNIVPQNGEMNRGVWAGLEGATRGCANTLGDLYVLTGPIFGGRARTIGTGRVAVPSSLYKIVVSGGEARAFVLPNKTLPESSSYVQFETTVAAVQTQTGLTLFPAGGVNVSVRGRFCAGSFGG